MIISYRIPPALLQNCGTLEEDYVEKYKTLSVIGSILINQPHDSSLLRYNDFFVKATDSVMYDSVDCV